MTILLELKLERLCLNTTGSEHYEAVVATGTRYSIPRHGDRCMWDWGNTLRDLDVAWQRHRMLAEWAQAMTPDQRDALWGEPGEAAARMRRVMCT